MPKEEISKDFEAESGGETKTVRELMAEDFLLSRQGEQLYRRKRSSESSKEYICDDQNSERDR